MKRTLGPVLSVSLAAGSNITAHSDTYLHHCHPAPSPQVQPMRLDFNLQNCEPNKPFFFTELVTTGIVFKLVKSFYYDQADPAIPDLDD